MKKPSKKPLFFLFLLLPFFFVALINHVYAAASLVQVRSNEIDASSTLNIQVSSTVQGNTLIGCFGWFSANADPSPHITSIVDNASDTWTAATAAPVAGFNPGTVMQIFYAKDIGAGVKSVTTTVSSISNADGFAGIIHEVSGLTLSPLDASSIASGTSSVFNSGTSTTHAADEYLLGCGEGWEGLGTITPTPPWHNEGEVDGEGNAFTIDRVVSSTGQYSAVASSSGNGDNLFVMGMATFEVADIIPPSVAWVSPSNNAIVTSTITLKASSTDDVAVSSTAFYFGSFGGTFASSTLIGATTTASGTIYSMSWNTANVSNGSTTLWALATDTSNNTSTASTTVNVENPPVITSIASSTSLTTSTITWTTNEAAASLVNYGLTASYGSSTATATLVTNHSLTLTNLAPSSTYHFQILSTDAQGNTSTSSDQIFKTQGDVTPPSVPTSVISTVISSSEIDLMWASSTDDVGVAGYQVLRNGMQIATTTNTFYADTGLAAGTSYSYAIKAFDAAGNISAPSASAAATTQSVGPTSSIIVSVPSGYLIGYPPGYIPAPTTSTPVLFPTGTPPAVSSGTNASIAATIATLTAQLNALLSQAGNEVSSTTYTFTRDLQLHDTGLDVRALQQLLIAKNSGLAARALAVHGATQYFGMLTYSALREYQKSVGLPGTGYFGMLTKRYIGQQ